jgi:hypothetical protein
MRTLHRWTMVLASLFLLYVAVTGMAIQIVDLKSLLGHAPASDPNMQSIREGVMGPPGFTVIMPEDYTAAALPPVADAPKLLATVQAAARLVAPEEPFKWIELRMQGSIPVGVVSVAGTNARQLEFNALTGAAMGAPVVVSPFAMFIRNAPSTHDFLKALHRGDVIGQTGAWFSLFTGIALFIMVISGLVMYFKLLAARSRAGRTGLFWK